MDSVKITIGEITLTRAYWATRLPLNGEVVELPGKIVTTVMAVWNKPATDEVVVVLAEGIWHEMPQPMNEKKVEMLKELGFEEDSDVGRS